MNISSSDSSSDDEEVNQYFNSESKKIDNDLLPQTSKEKYLQCWNQFLEWQKANRTSSFAEDRFLTYFKELSQKYSPATLWSKWSMLRAMAALKRGINLRLYPKLKTFVKNKSKGYRPKQAPTFQLHDIMRFINGAADVIWLSLKVVAILGICGAMRCAELCTLKATDVVDLNPRNDPELPKRFSVTVIDAKKQTAREFVVGEPFYDVIKKYCALRPSDVPELNFFLKYQNGKIIRQNMGKNTFGGAPRKIADYLELPNKKGYRGHSWRRTGATCMANAGGTLIDIKRLGGWLSDRSAQLYVDRCPQAQVNNFNMIMNSSATNDIEPLRNKDATKSSANTGSLAPSARKRVRFIKALDIAVRSGQNDDTQERSTNSIGNEQGTGLNSKTPNHSENLWGEENEAWMQEVATNSIFIDDIDIPKISQQGKDAVKRTRLNTNIPRRDWIPDSDPGTSSDDTTKVQRPTPPDILTDNYSQELNSQNCCMSPQRSLFTDLRVPNMSNNKNPCISSLSGPPGGNSTAKENPTNFDTINTMLKYGSGIQMHNCTINNLTINNYYCDKENRPRHNT